MLIEGDCHATSEGTVRNWHAISEETDRNCHALNIEFAIQM